MSTRWPREIPLLRRSTTSHLYELKRDLGSLGISRVMGLIFNWRWSSHKLHQGLHSVHLHILSMHQGWWLQLWLRRWRLALRSTSWEGLSTYSSRAIPTWNRICSVTCIYHTKFSATVLSLRSYSSCELSYRSYRIRWNSVSSLSIWGRNLARTYLYKGDQLAFACRVVIEIEEEVVQSSLHCHRSRWLGLWDKVYKFLTLIHTTTLHLNLNLLSNILSMDSISCESNCSTLIWATDRINWSKTLYTNLFQLTALSHLHY